LIDSSLDERLRQIKERLEKLVMNDILVEKHLETTPDELTAFGISLSQAKAWLKREPNFPSDVSYHEPQNRRRVNRTLSQAIR